MYHITVYAALTLYRDAQTWAKGQAGKKALANLKQALSALNNAPAGVVALEIKYDHHVVSEMRAELKIRRPSITATVSDQVVSSGAKATLSGQPVSTSSEATVSGQAVSLGSTTEASDHPVLMDDPASERTHAIEKTAAHETKRRVSEPKRKAAAKPTRTKRSRVATEAEAVGTLRHFSRSKLVLALKHAIDSTVMVRAPAR